MKKGILGKKLGMTQVFLEDGEVVSVTVVEALPNVVMQKKTIETDGYEAMQIGFAEKKASRATKSEQGHAEKANTKPKRFVQEIRGVDTSAYEVGNEIKVDVFSEGETVDVTGTSKGKGLQGVIKRHNQAKGPMTHGSRYHRGPGSLGSVDASRVFKGKPLPGRMGGERTTLQNLEIVKVDTERNLLLIKGNVPGPKQGLVTIQTALKAVAK